MHVLADISRSHYVVIINHSNASRAPIANPPNSAQLGAPLTIPPSYIRVHVVVWACGDGQTCVTKMHFASSTTHAKCKQVVKVI